MVETGEVGQPALDPLGYLQAGVLEGGAGPGRLHNHRAEGEGGVLVAAETDEGQAAGQEGGEMK